MESAPDDHAALDWAARRAAGEPLQYVTGEAHFRHLRLSVGPGVFIPRPETELITDRALDHLPHGGSMLDVGTGSGAIALSVKHERPDARVIASEASPEALAWFHKNRADLDLAVDCYEADLFEGLPRELAGEIDVIVSNPPYVADEAAAALPKDIVDHEPHRALFAGREGLSVIARLVDGARAWLKPGGWLVFEMGERQQEGVVQLLDGAGFMDVAVGVDLADWPRITEARLS